MAHPRPVSHEPWIAPVLRVLARISPGMVLRNFQLGVQFFRANQTLDARRRLEWVLVLQPQHMQARFYLSWLLVEQKLYGYAVPHLEYLLKLQPQSQEVRFLLARATECHQPFERLPTTTPVRFLQRSYTPSADRYDAVQSGLFGIQVAREVVRRLVKWIPVQGSAQFRVLDLGCATGAVGAQLWPLGVALEGVDVVSALASQARQRVRATSQQIRERDTQLGMGEGQDNMGHDGDMRRLVHRKPFPPVYSSVWVEEIRHFLARQTQPRFDAVLAADVVPELGAMNSVFGGVAKALKPGGVFIFSHTKGPMQGFSPSGRRVRFAHSVAYLDAQAAEAGLELVEHSTGPYDSQSSCRYSVYRKPDAAKPNVTGKP